MGVVGAFFKIQNSDKDGRQRKRLTTQPSLSLFELYFEYDSFNQSNCRYWPSPRFDTCNLTLLIIIFCKWIFTVYILLKIVWLCVQLCTRFMLMNSNAPCIMRNQLRALHVLSVYQVQAMTKMLNITAHNWHIVKFNFSFAILVSRTLEWCSGYRQ